MATHPKERYTGADNMNMRQFRGKPVYIGPLPDTFLRVDVLNTTNNNSSQIQFDEELAASLQQRYDQQARSRRDWSSQYKAQLVITFVEAKLAKNYGLINMNPYIRLRVGHSIFETRTNHKGGKNPKWNESMNCYLPKGVDTLSIEIYDECLLTNDEMIAWTTFQLPERYFNPENASCTFEESIVLNGKQGDGLEGNLYVVFTVKPITAAMAPVARPPVMYQIPAVIAGTRMPPYTASVRPIVPRLQETVDGPVSIRDDDVKALHEMFPSIETDVLKSVLASERGNLDRAINACLELSSIT